MQAYCAYLLLDSRWVQQVCGYFCIRIQSPTVGFTVGAIVYCKFTSEGEQRFNEMCTQPGLLFEVLVSDVNKIFERFFQDQDQDFILFFCESASRPK